jgi:hypothetical protein
LQSTAIPRPELTNRLFSLSQTCAAFLKLSALAIVKL